MRHTGPLRVDEKFLGPGNFGRLAIEPRTSYFATMKSFFQNKNL